jgi:hypothetical protein
VGLMNLGVMEMLLAFGPLLAFAIWELYALRKKAVRRRERSRREGTKDLQE